jgi:hypothetical protein
MIASCEDSTIAAYRRRGAIFGDPLRIPYASTARTVGDSASMFAAGDPFFSELAAGRRGRELMARLRLPVQDSQDPEEERRVMALEIEIGGPKWHFAS